MHAFFAPNYIFVFYEGLDKDKPAKNWTYSRFICIIAALTFQQKKGMSKNSKNWTVTVFKLSGAYLEVC